MEMHRNAHYLDEFLEIQLIFVFLYILMEPQLLPRHFPLSAGYTEKNSVNAGWFVFFGPGTVLSPFAISAMGEEYINNAL